MVRVRVECYPNREVRCSVGPDRAPHLYRPRAGEGGGPPIGSDFSTGGGAPLVISSEFSGARLRTHSGYGAEGGRTTFGSAARRTMLRAGGVMEVDGIPPNHCLFLTGTLPGSTGAAKWAIAAWSGWIVKQVKDWLRTFGAGLYSLYCWEQQQRGALHLHYCVHLPCPEARLRCWARFQAFWVSLMRGVSDRSGVDVFERSYGGTWAGRPEVVRATAEVCRKSVAAYLSKYLSKGSRDSAPVVDAEGERHAFYPSRWWGVSRPLLARLAELSYSVELECLGRAQGEEVWDAVQDWISRHYSRPCETEDQLDGEEYGRVYDYRDKSGQWRVTTAYGYRPIKEELGDLLGPRYWDAANAITIFARRTAKGAVGDSKDKSGGPFRAHCVSPSGPILNSLEVARQPSPREPGRAEVPRGGIPSTEWIQPKLQLVSESAPLGGNRISARRGGPSLGKRVNRVGSSQGTGRNRGGVCPALPRIREYLATGGAPARYEAALRHRDATLGASPQRSKELGSGPSDLPALNS